MLKHKLKIPELFLDRMCLQSNGFSGYEVSLDQHEEVESYSKYQTIRPSEPLKLPISI